MNFNLKNHIYNEIQNKRYEQKLINEKLYFLKILLNFFQEDYQFILDLIIIFVKDNNLNDTLITFINTRINKISNNSSNVEKLCCEYNKIYKELESAKIVLKNKLYNLP